MSNLGRPVNFDGTSRRPWGKTGRRQSPDPILGFDYIRAQIDRSFNEFILETEKNQAQLPKIATQVLQNIDDLPCVINLAQFQGKDHKPDLIAAHGFKKEDLKGTLHLSNVIFAKEAVPAGDSLPDHRSFKRQLLQIFPYPFTTIKRNLRLFVYFEIYDLKRDETGETFYEVEYEVKAPEKKGLSELLASLNPFGKSRGSIAVTDTRRGKATTEPTYLQLDFSQLRGGNYNLVMRVTDKVANITKESPDLSFKISE